MITKLITKEDSRLLFVHTHNLALQRHVTHIIYVPQHKWFVFEE